MELPKLGSFTLMDGKPITEFMKLVEIRAHCRAKQGTRQLLLNSQGP